MFEPTHQPRAFGIAPGVDFPKALVQGLEQRFDGRPPEALARVHLIVNTRRMTRRIVELFQAGPARLLPRISLVTDMTALSPMPLSAATISPLRRRLELAQLIGKLIDRQPDLAARASLYDLANSLADLIDEMHGEGVSTDAIRDLDVSDMSGHWARALSFFAIADQFRQINEGKGMDAQARLRQAVERQIARWQDDAPPDPVILAGSTGSRGTTAMLMAAVSKLPQGAIILPGYDFDLPERIWASLDDAILTEDHPQFRFRKLMNDLGIGATDIRPWADTAPPSPPRNRLVSLALRPAPITDAWMSEGPALTDLAPATARMTLIESPSPRAEAMAIALRLRQAAETGQTAALITPDRMLSRRVSAALDRWDIEPDDSAGLPLHLSPPGRFLRHVAELFVSRLTAQALLTLLRHPLCHGGAGRGRHLLHTRDLDLHLRRKGPPFPDADSMAAVRSGGNTPLPAQWRDWLGENILGQTVGGERTLTGWLALLRSRAEAIAAGSRTSGSGPLWERGAGQEAQAVIAALETEAEHGSAMTARAFADLLGALLAEGIVRDRDKPHPRIMIWGTLEARVQGADLLILGGLNEGSWPEPARPDPWLNRRMRDQAGLLLPERRIGLSAHDFQQAIAAPEVWLTRSLRSDDADSVASRWLNRLTNLLAGLPGQGGPEALAEMRTRGRMWLDRVDVLEAAERTAPAPRPSPRPPVAARPRSLSVTEIKRLIRDPYAIYAKHVLRLRPLDPLAKSPDALLRGNVVHKVLEDIVRASLSDMRALDLDRFLVHAGHILEAEVPWPTARRLWLARMERIAGAFREAEIQRRATAMPVAFETTAQAQLDPPGFTLSGRADRIDRDQTGGLIIYDYKTGAPPSAAQQAKFDKQLLLSAAIAEQGGFAGLDPAPVVRAAFLGVGTTLKEVDAPLDEEPPTRVWDDLRKLILAYLDPMQGFTSRRMLERDTDKGDYDQLARFGEWDYATDPTPEDMT